MNPPSPPADRLVLREDRQGVCTLTLNRPDKHNAVTPELFTELHDHLVALQSGGGDIGVVVLRGAGKSFCAGHDLAAAVGKMSLEWLRHESRTLELFSLLPQIVIAAVHGHCITGGLELALAADLIVASESAQFCDTHGRYGLVAAWGLTQRLPRRVGQAKALELITTSARIGGREAERIGLANRCVPDAEFDAELARLCAAILGNSAHSNAAHKRLMTETDGMSLTSGLAHEQFRSPGSKRRDAGA